MSNGLVLMRQDRDLVCSLSAVWYHESHPCHQEEHPPEHKHAGTMTSDFKPPEW